MMAQDLDMIIIRNPLFIIFKLTKLSKISKNANNNIPIAMTKHKRVRISKKLYLCFRKKSLIHKAIKTGIKILEEL